MHGRPRSAPKPNEAVSAAKAANLRSLRTQFIYNHQLRIYDENALAICAKLLEINPEMYTAWNYRKVAVNSLLGSLTEEKSVKPVLDEELRVVESALKQNPKCYAAWHHRKWLLEKGKSLIDLGGEFKLLDMLLTLDGRNFNGWSYRRFVAGLKNMSVEEELKFTTNKIDSNFSNYSAWHNRSILLSYMLMHKAKGIASRDKVLVEELDLVHQAIFTDPDDQSGWFYHLWLLKETIGQNTPVILSSWPRHGSIILVCSNLASDGIPIILYFSQPVGGVSSSTVNVECVSAESQHLPWSPLSTDKSGKARAWCAHLKIENVDDLPKDYVVKVCVGSGSGQGIISSYGAYSKHPHVFEFTLNLQSNNLEGVKNCSTEIYSWAIEKLSCSDHFIQELHSVIDVDKLKITEDCKNSISQFCAEILKNEIQLFRELVAACECKIGILTLARLLMVHNDILSHGFLSSHEMTDCEEILKMFDMLMKVDPKHHLYYKDMRSLVSLEQMTSNALTEHHYCEEGPDDPVKSHCKAFLCLDKLSISRFGFVERLLWVQVLDLSHNELQSVEGFEAMQLLKCLNLSYNKFRSFTALEPLRLIRLLSVLDISFNEIGSHSIDTSRYLCSSPLPHSTDASWTLETCGTGCVELEHCLGAAMTFKDMNLVQLNVAGNAISEEKFKKFLQRILPSLKWLDGVEIQ